MATALRAYCCTLSSGAYPIPAQHIYLCAMSVHSVVVSVALAPRRACMQERTRHNTHASYLCIYASGTKPLAEMGQRPALKMKGQYLGAKVTSACATLRVKCRSARHSWEIAFQMRPSFHLALFSLALH